MSTPRKCPGSLVCLFLLTAQLVAVGAAAGDGLAESEEYVSEGRRLFLRGDYEKAADAFAEALGANPESCLARLWVARSRRALGQPVETSDELERCADRLDVDETGQSVGSSNEYLAELAEPTWEWRLDLEAGYDSNPVLELRDAVATEPISSIVSPDSDAVFGVGIRGEVHPFSGRGGWSLGLVFEIDHLLHQDLGFLDSSRLRGTAQLAWGSDPIGYLAGPLGYTRVPFGNSRFAALLQASADYRLLDGDSFEESAAAGVALTVRESRLTASRADLVLEHLEVTDDGGGALERSGDGWSAGVSQYLYLKRQDRYLRLRLEVGERDAGAAFDASHMEAGVDLSLPLAPRWRMQLAAARRDLDFDDVASNPLFPLFLADAPRQDSATGIDADLIFKATDRMRLVLRGAWVERDFDLGSVANILDLDYDRTTASVGLTWFF